MKKKSLLVNGSVLLLSTVVSLIVLEQSYRFYLFGFDSFSVEKMNSVHSLGVSGITQRADHPEIVYELKPNLDLYFKLAKFKTNSDGLRDKEAIP